MFNQLNKKAFPLLAGLIVLVNIVLLTKVGFNRSEVLAKVTLTERELPLPYYQREENSGLNLRVNFRAPSDEINEYSAHYGSSPNWLTMEKMQSLGFEADLVHSEKRSSNVEHYRNTKGQTKEVFIALEYNSTAYQASLAKVKKWHAEQSLNRRNNKPGSHISQDKIDTRLKEEQQQASRLFAIDAALTLETLTEQYADNPNIIYLRGLVSSYSGYESYVDGEALGYIRLSNSHINLPSRFNPHVKDLPRPDHRKVNRPRYSVELEIGKGLEPFVVGVEYTTK